MFLQPQVKEKIHLQRKYNKYRNVVQCPLRHVTYASTQFEVTMSKGLGGDAFTRKKIQKCCPVSSTSCDLCIYTVWSYYVKRFRRRCIYKKIQYLKWKYIIWNVAQYHLHHATYSCVWVTKFEVAISNGSGGDTFTRKYIIWPMTLTMGSRSHEMLPSIIYIMWPIQL